MTGIQHEALTKAAMLCVFCRCQIQTMFLLYIFDMYMTSYHRPYHRVWKRTNLIDTQEIPHSLLKKVFCCCCSSLVKEWANMSVPFGVQVWSKKVPWKSVCRWKYLQIFSFCASLCLWVGSPLKNNCLFTLSLHLFYVLFCH